MNRLSKILLSFLVLFVVAMMSMGWFFSNIILFPQNTDMAEDIGLMPEKWGMTYEEVTAQLPTPIDFSVQSVDEVTIKGWVYDHPDTARCAVIYSHGWGSSRVGMLKFADLFWDCGCDLIFYDHRMHSESGGIVATAGIKEKEDLLKVTEWVQDNYGYVDQQIAWFGESWGGATVLQAGATDKDVAFIVADSPFQDWDSAIFERGRRQYGEWMMMIAPAIMGLVDWRAEVDHDEANPKEAAKSIKEPVFLIHSKGDKATASYQSENIAKNLPTATSEFHHTDWGSDHVQDIITRPDEYRALLYRFIQDKVGTFGTCPE